MKPKLTKKCVECGCEFVQKPHESCPKFLKRQFCSIICTRKYFKKHNVGFFNKEVTNNYYYNDKYDYRENCETDY